MNTQRELDQHRSEENREGQDPSLVFFSILLFDALLGIFSAIAFTFSDIRSAIVLGLAGLLAFVGLALQMIIGLNRYITSFYGLVGAAIFFYLVAKGGTDASSLFAALGLIFGFVIVLGWRMASWYLVIMAQILAIVFFWDIYFLFGEPFPVVVELKFFVAFVGLALLTLAYGYTIETKINSLKRYSQKMSFLAYKDGMTNLPNRRSTEDILKQRWEEFKRGGAEFAVLLCNIDNFKELNSQYGNGFGDGVILRIANVLVHGLRSQDIISRWGGDEFLIILPGQTSQTALKVAERIRSRIENIDLVMHGKTVSVTVSLGVSAVQQSLGPPDLVSMAESGLYQAKHTGKNRVMLG